MLIRTQEGKSVLRHLESPLAMVVTLTTIGSPGQSNELVPPAQNNSAIHNEKDSAATSSLQIRQRYAPPLSKRQGPGGYEDILRKPRRKDKDRPFKATSPELHNTYDEAPLVRVLEPERVGESRKSGRGKGRGKAVYPYVQQRSPAIDGKRSTHTKTAKGPAAPIRISVRDLGTDDRGHPSQGSIGKPRRRLSKSAALEGDDSDNLDDEMVTFQTHTLW